MKREGKDSKGKRVPGGYPLVADPRDKGAYGWQVSFVYAWFVEMLARLDGEDVIAARAAREALGSAYLGLTRVLLGLAKKGKDKTARQWAGVLLASVHGSIAKHEGELSKKNEAYRDEKKKLGKLRKDVLLPKGYRTLVGRELREAERMRGRLLVIRSTCGEEWREEAKRQGISESYLPAMKLAEFSSKSLRGWWLFLWPLIKKNNPEVLEKLRGDAKRKEVVWTYLDGVSKRQVKERKLFWSAFQTQFRNHLKALAEARECGISHP